jgi:hypothetical protein
MFRFPHDSAEYVPITTERRRMIIKSEVLVLAGILWLGPKLTPEQAASVLRDSPASVNMTGKTLVAHPRGISDRPVVHRVSDRVRVVHRPLNCCSTYVMPLPEPTLNVRFIK